MSRSAKSSPPVPKRGHVVLGVTGSIAAYTACDLVMRLKERGFDVTVVMTRDAQHFVTPLTFAAVSGREVFTELFKLPQEGEPNPVHTTLAATADVIVIAPASADVIGKIANGLADDLLTCIVMASTAPKVVVPAMNVHMYQNPLVQENIKKLKGLGFRFVGPNVGELVCGYEAIGHVASPDDILQVVQRLLK